MTRPGFWPFDERRIGDPYPGYAEQRAAHPIEHLPEYGITVVTGHPEVTAVLREPRGVVAEVPSSSQLGGGDGRLGAPVRGTLQRMIALSDDPRRRPTRAAFQRAFSIDAVAGRRPLVRGWADELLTEAERRAGDGPVDVVELFALPLTGAVLDDLLGLDAAEGNHIRLRWSPLSATVDDPTVGLPADAPRLLAEIVEPLCEALDRARTASTELPIGILAAGIGAGELDRDEVVANLVFVLTSGHRSLAQSLALAIHTLATHPDQFHRLRADPVLAPHAVEELLRWDGPVHLIQRVIAHPMTIDGCPLPAGEPVMLFLAAADRDPRVFKHAEVLDLTARSAHHVAFGHGAHYCVGATFARMVLREAIGALAERCPALRLARDPQWTVPRRGLDHLWVSW